MNEVAKKILLVNFSHAVFSLLDFFTLEDGNDSLFQNVDNNFIILRCVISQKSGGLK